VKWIAWSIAEIWPLENLELWSYVCLCLAAVNGSLTAVVVVGRLLISRHTHESHQMPADLHGSLSRGIKQLFHCETVVLCVVTVVTMWPLCGHCGYCVTLVWSLLSLCDLYVVTVVTIWSPDAGQLAWFLVTRYQDSFHWHQSPCLWESNLIHTADADTTQLLSWVASKFWLVTRCVLNLQLAHDDCRRILSKIWKLNMLRIYPAELSCVGGVYVTQFTIILQP